MLVLFRYLYQLQGSRWIHCNTVVSCSYLVIMTIFFMGFAAQSRAVASSFLRFFEITHSDTPQSVRTPLDKWSARRRDLYLTTHNTHNRQTSLLPAGFEPTISAGERPQTYALDRAATGTGDYDNYSAVFNYHWLRNVPYNETRIW